MLVPDLAHQFLQDVFQGHQTFGAAVLVHHHGHMHLPALHFIQQIGHRGGGGDVDDRRDQVFPAVVVPQLGLVKVLFVDHADDGVDAAVPDGNTGEAVGGDQLIQLLGAGLVGDGHNVHPRRQDLLYLHVSELNGGTDEAALVLIQPPFVLSGGDHGDQLVFRDAPIAIGVEQTPYQLLEQAEQDGQRAQNHGEHPQKGGCGHGPALCVFFGDGLGADLPKGEDDQGQDHRGDGGAILRAELGEEQGAQGGGGDVDNIIAHQKGGEQSVKIFSQAQGGLGLAVAVVRHIPQSDLVQRGKGGLGGGEVC